MQPEPFFTILVPTYNQANYLPEALDSIIAQTNPNWEAVVVNDGSVDETSLVIRRYTELDARIRGYNKANGGVASALNEGLKHAKGEWICWLSSDDYFKPDKLAAHCEVINQYPQIKFFYTNFYELDDLTHQVSAPNYTHHFVEDELQTIRFFFSNYINGITIAVHRSVFDDVGFFNEAYWCGQDFDLWLRISTKYRFKFIDQRLSVTRIHPGQTTYSIPGAGIFDSARGALDFLNANPFEAFFPAMDLSIQQNIEKALSTAIQVATTPNAFINISGFTNAFLDRLAEWIVQQSPFNLRSALKLSLVNKCKEIQPHNFPGYIKLPFKRLENNLTCDFHYTPYDAFTEMKYFNSSIVMENPNTAQAMNRYLMKISENFQSEFPLVSVIIPTYNRPDLVKKALTSITQQTYPNIEVIVVNDAGQDVGEIVRTFADRLKIVYQNNRQNQGAGGARNTGMSLARGQYIAFLDDDDIYYPAHLQILIESLAANLDVIGVYSDAVQVNILMEGSEKKVISRQVVFSVDYSLDILLVQNFIPNLCLVIRSSILSKTGGFDVQLKALEDWEWLLRLAQHGLLKHVPLVTAEYQTKLNSESRNLMTMDQKADLYRSFYERYSYLATPAVQHDQALLYKHGTGKDLVINASGKNMEFARYLLQQILDADDIQAAVIQFRHLLNQNVITAINREKLIALQENNPDLADGLDGLSNYIDQFISKGPRK